MSKKKKIQIIACILLACVLIFAIYWKATEKERYIKGELNDIQEQVEAFRSGEKDYFHIFFLDYVAEDPRMEELLISLVKEMCENREGEMLLEFLAELEDCRYWSETLASILNERLGSSGDLEFVFSVLDSGTFKYSLKYYNEKVTISRNTAFLAAYIAEHGTRSFTTTPGEGYYAGEEDSHKKNVIGLPTSPLHDAETVTYQGDFKCVHSYGVRLNSYYEETTYSSYTYFFRGSYVPFGPELGDIVWSGDYLFSFDYDGNLIAFGKLDAKE